MTRALLALLVALLPTPAPQGARPLARARLDPRSIEGCEGLPFPRGPRELWSGGDRAVDVASGFWLLDRPIDFRAGRAEVRFRVGSGVLLARARLGGDLTEETVELSEETPIDPAHRSVYLGGLTLPCERHTRYAVERLEPQPGDLDALARFDALLLEAVELQYDARFDEARARLQRARELRPGDPAPYWLFARLEYLELEQNAAAIPAGERARRFAGVEHWADQAVERAPDQAEGYLWQGVARGRIATSVGNLRIALSGAVGGRGPAWLEHTLRRAAELPERFRFFGFGTRGDALYALAQFYRLAPDGWYMRLVGTRGDRERAVEFARQSVSIQPLRIEYRKELAIALLCRGGDADLREARSELSALLEIPAITALDRIDQAHARALQASVPENICWYSRDGFMEAGG